jgi:heat shock protein HslJ
MKHLFTLLAAASVITFTSCDETKKITESPTVVNSEYKASITDVFWSLTEVMGKPVVLAPDTKMIFVRFNSKDNKLEGNAGCNNMFGKFELSDNERIKVSGLGSTKMACEGTRMEIENNFMKVLEMADSYFIKGDTLQLFKARMAPLARFEAKYFPR